jgi:hypothetical protein
VIASSLATKHFLMNSQPSLAVSWTVKPWVRAQYKKTMGAVVVVVAAAHGQWRKST